MRSLAIQRNYLILRYLLIRRVIVLLTLYEYFNRLTGNRTKMTTPEGRVVNYAYDSGNRITSINGNGDRLI